MAIHAPVSQFMTTHLRVVSPSTQLLEAHRVLREHAISSLPVLEGGRLVGVVTRTDLLRLGRVERRSPKGALLALPDLPVGEVMRREPITVSPDTAVSAASTILVSRHIHRVFVTEGNHLTGVFSTRDVMTALEQQKSKAPISDFMSSPVLTVDATDTLGQATAKLDDAHVSGLVVLDDGAAAGLFTQVEALQAATEPASTPVEDVMGYALLCLDLKTPLYRAAAHASATRARRVIATEHRKLWGILTGIDFARAAIGRR